MGRLPTGTVTFLFTDVEGSTRLLEELGEHRGILEDQTRLIRGAVAESGGVEISTEGDSLFAVFPSAIQGASAAVEAQRALAAWPWPEEAAVLVRMGLHTGEGVIREDSYRGLDVHRAARIAAAAHGGQVVLSEATRTLAAHALPAGTTLRDLGEHRLKDLTRPEHLYQLAIEGLPSEFPPLRTLEAVPNNLPVQLTSFIGRQEVGMVKDLLADSRLLTLTGVGGAGKTRLSLQVAAEVAGDFRHGVWFVPLDSISDPELVPPTIASTLRLTRTHKGPLDHLREYLMDRQLLLLLDNFEQVLPAAAAVSDLLRAAPDLKVLVTSRAPLHVYGEQEFSVPPLPVPDPEEELTPQSLAKYEAVALFVERASAVRPDFTLTQNNARAIAEITARLDGLPLAIELAAARVKLLSPEVIAQRLGSRLALLTGGSRDLPTRQRTLRDAIAWSYELLPEPGRRLLARLAVFMRGTGLEEAEKVCGPAAEAGVELLDGLGMLVDQSLVRHEDVNGTTRFRLLDTIREFAWERLQESGEISEIRRRFAHAYLDVAEQAEPHLLTSDQARWLDTLEVEHNNLRAALDWGVELQETDFGLRLAASLWRFWQFRGHLKEAGDRLARALALPGGTSRLRARACEAAGGVAYWRGDMEACRILYQESLDIARRLADRVGEANALYNLSFAYLMDTAGERAHLRERALAIYEGLGNQHGVAKVLWSLGNVAADGGDLRRSRALLEQSLGLFRELDDPFGVGWCLFSLADNEFMADNPEQSVRLFREGLALFEELGDVSAMVLHLDSLALLAWYQRRPDRALRLAGATARFGERSGVGLADPEFDRPEFEAVREELLRAAGEPPGQDLTSEGSAMTLKQAVAYALSGD